ncbi:sensor histidine kinase [Baekduia soli]|uniref:sensor histidine kinase n=1 Tax=Baekduia soli TaxID=496014 RepID=UPI001651E32A|nr:HAMP domain-containing sensor histidine kinase [Baekduia soli]
MGHELKSPLSIMLALCGRMEESGQLEGQNAEDLARIRANAYSLLRRVQDMMLMARLETFDPQLELAVVDVAAIVRACVDGFQSLAAERDLDLRTGLPDHLPAMADEEKLVSVVTNLLANAIRHAPQGGVVRCTLHAPEGRMLLEVADDGPGVPPGERDAIFERYQRGAQSGGSGLGLAIVREIVQLHGGSAAVGDAPEGGALFVVDLPLTLTRGARAAALSSLRLADRQKAIVEDLRAELGTYSRPAAAPPELLPRSA